MAKYKLKNRRGLTLVELIIAMIASAILLMGMGFILADGQKSWHRMYNSVYSDIITETYVAKNAFEALARKSSSSDFLMDQNGQWLEVHYYADDYSENVDRYARFSQLNDKLNIEQGTLVEIEDSQFYQNVPLKNYIICENVSECVFTKTGQSAHMVLTLNKDSETITIVCSAVMHNE